MKPEERDEAIDKAISSVKGREKLAEVMGEVIRDELVRPSALSGLVVSCCSKCLMPEDEFMDGEHSEEECIVYRVMES
ncbi:hypothetical protein LCGC14_2235090 [marine sediment metagenome]|uniref:Uncharacterized protein n=1 Tax=marine sediment metagenome TaxID=412755 RepID=A0A0F9FJN0_9ZZZZ